MRRRWYLVPYMLTGLLAWLWLIFLPLPSTAQEILSTNTSRYLGNDKWEWTIFIKTSPEVVEEIESVKYQLYPTFSSPVRTECSVGDPNYPFGLTAAGWGAFEIPIEVTFKSGAVRLLKHNLVFAAPPVQDPLAISAANVATKVDQGWWNWTIFIQGPNHVLDQIQCVEYTLHPTFPNPVREVTDRGAGTHAFPLTTSSWGTFPIHIRVFLKDGQIQELTHNIKS